MSCDFCGVFKVVHGFGAFGLGVRYGGWGVERSVSGECVKGQYARKIFQLEDRIRQEEEGGSLTSAVIRLQTRREDEALLTQRQCSRLIIQVLRAYGLTARARGSVSRHAIAILNGSGLDRSIRIVSLFVHVGLVVFQAIGRTCRVHVLFSNAQFARITRLEALSIGAFATFRAAIRLARYRSEGVRLLNRPLR